MSFTAPGGRVITLNGGAGTKTVAFAEDITSLLSDKLDLSGGTMTGPLVANSVTNSAQYLTAQMRNVIISTGTPTGGSSGDIWIKYV